MADTAKYETTIGSKFYISKVKMSTLPSWSTITDMDSDLTGSSNDWVDGSCATSEISFQGGQKTDIDVTSLCSTTQEVTNGLAAPGEITLTRNWTVDDKMLDALEESSDKNDLRGYVVRFNSGNGFMFLAEVRQNSWSAATAGKVTASYTLRVRGKIIRLPSTT